MTTMMREAKTHLDADFTIKDVRFDEQMLWIELIDGRVVGSPLAWSTRLKEATPEQRENWRLIAGRTSVHWPDLDEDISVRVLMNHSS